MPIIERTSRRPVLDLAGPEGNAFALLGLVRSSGRQLEWSKEKIAAIQAEMTSGDYKNLVAVFDRELGEFYDIILPENGL